MQAQLPRKANHRDTEHGESEQPAIVEARRSKDASTRASAGKLLTLFAV